jgi:phosphoglucosamine mutase
MKISLDTANGASSITSVEILRRLGAELTVHHNTPNGDNINVDCGCTYPDIISGLLKSDGSQIGVSHDGDADRILLCDESGSPIAGDELMALVGCHLLETGRLAEKTLVATKMSNFGLDECIEARGGKVERTEIGDRHVINRMREIGANFGGEQSGHLICRDQNTTGDGILAALAALRAVKETGKPLSEMRKVLTPFPQKLVSFHVTSKPALADMQAAGLISEVENTLGAAGRVLIRYSGTEPKIRVMVEGKDADYVDTKTDEISAAIGAEIGE